MTTRSIFAVSVAALAVTAKAVTGCQGDACPRAEMEVEEGVLLQVHGANTMQAEEGDGSPATPYFLMQCPKPKALKTWCMTKDGYDKVVQDVRELIETLPDTCNETVCPQADVAGCILRMAGHDFMDFNPFGKHKGGSDGCTNMEHPDNAGLAACLVSGDNGKSLQSVYAKYCHWLSLADFIVIAAEAAMTSTRARVLQYPPPNQTNPLPIDFKPYFRYGRKTAKYCPSADGLLPNPENGCDDVGDVFVRRMGLSWGAAAALMGVHTLGRAHPSNSGYDGWWSDPDNSRRFSNNYYVMFVVAGWVPQTLSPNNHQWQRSDREKESKRGVVQHQMMLNTDLCLLYTDGTNYIHRGRPVKAQDTECCAWVTSRTVPGAILLNNDKYCGGSPSTKIQIEDAGREEHEDCCHSGVSEEPPPGGEVVKGSFERSQEGDSSEGEDCGNFFSPEGPAAESVLNYANNEDAWLRAFLAAWTQATENGFEPWLRPLQDTCSKK